MTKGKISPELLQKIKDSIHMTEVVGEHVVLRKSGAHFVGLCPFHSERSPSFSVSESKQLYHCYGCKKGGDLVSFVMEIMGISFPEAVEELAERARVALPKDWGGASSDEEVSEKDRKTQLQRERLALAFKLNRFAAAYYHQNLSRSPKAVQYLASRGISMAENTLVREFYVGAASDSWDSLAKYLVQKKAPLDLATELGLIRPSTKPRAEKDLRGQAPGPGYFDLLRNRALFPILNLRGKVAGFGGRTLGDEQPKYLNSPESPTFQKSKLVFGLYQAQKHIREKDEVILVEGYFDVLALHKAGFQNVVATCGTSLTADHLKLLRRFATRLTVLFDGDSAGISATERAMEAGLDQGWVLYGAQLPAGMDPDEIIFELGKESPHGKERMAQILNAAKPLLDTKINQALGLDAGAQNGQARKALSSEEQSQALKKVGVWLARLQDPIGKDIRIQYLQKELGIPRQLVLRAMGQVSGAQPIVQASVSVRKNPQAPKAGLGKINPADRILIAGIVLGGDYVKTFLKVKDRLPPQRGLSDLLEDQGGREWVESMFTSERDLSIQGISPETWQRQWNSGIWGIQDNRIHSIAAEVLVAKEGNDPPISVGDFQVAVSKRVARCWARFSQQIKAAIAGAEAKKNIELHSQLMKEYLDVQRKMKEFSSFYDED